MTGWMRFFGVAGAAMGFVAVGLGAFAAHALGERLDPRSLQVFETGVRYQFFHALALLILALLGTQVPGAGVRIAGWCFLAGILLFSGSLYLVALSGRGVWGAVAPFGGTALLAGWIALAWHVATA